MKADLEQADVEARPLLPGPMPGPGQNGQRCSCVVVSEFLREEQQRRFDGSLLACCGAFDKPGCLSFLAGWCCAPFAFGWNMQRAFRLNWLLQAALFALLFWGGRSLYASAVTAVSTVCPPPPGEGPRPHHGPADSFVDSFTQGLDRQAEAEYYRRHEAPPHVSPECRQALAALHTFYLVMIVCSAAGVWIAARRRTAMREQFGIAGTQLGDMCSWLCCAPCALCQETRTLAKNVIDGTWHVGAEPDSSATLVVYVAPHQAAPMSAGESAAAKVKGFDV